jgi:hypothetical protein
VRAERGFRVSRGGEGGRRRRRRGRIFRRPRGACVPLSFFSGNIFFWKKKEPQWAGPGGPLFRVVWAQGGVSCIAVLCFIES